VFVERLRCSHFRNIRFADLELSPGLNCFLGLNGAGKTSFLEALHALSRGRSFRTPSLDSLTEFGFPEFAVSVEGTDVRRLRRTVVFRKQKGEPPGLEIDGARTLRASEVAALFPLQVITPDCGDLVMEGPAARRSFVDWGLFHVKPFFLKLSRDYSTALAQRNAWLKQTEDPAEQDPWLDPVARLGAEIDTWRREQVEMLIPEFRELCAGFEIEMDLSLTFYSGWDTRLGGLREALEASRRLDGERGFTRVGPHRGDLRIFADQKPVSLVASRGQAKLTAIALQLAQVALLNQQAAERTIVLFDELVAELDERHIEAVFEMMDRLQCQVLLSAVEVSEKLQTRRLARAKMFHVEHGVIREILE